MKAPKAPDPYATAAAQTRSNVDTATANSIIQNADENSPFGTVRYTNIGYDTVAGNQVPRYRRDVTLSPEQQNLYNQQTALGSQLNTIAQQQTAKIGNLLSKPVNLERYLPRYEEAIMSRMNPQLARDRTAMLDRLGTQGVTQGSEAYNRAVESSNQQMNDARMQAILASYDKGAEYALAERNQPINEISALMAGGQVSVPQFSQYRPGQVAGTDIAGLINQDYQRKLQNYQSQLGGIGGLFGTVLGLPMGGGASLGGRVFGGLFS